MFSSRAVLRSSRTIRSYTPRTRRNARFQSTSQPTRASESNDGFHPAFTGAIAGGACALAGGYLWYHFSGARTLVQSAKQTQNYLESAKLKLKESAPEPNEALKWLRQTATSYATFIPGASQYVNSAFDDLDSIRNKHGDEVDAVVKEAYDELKGLSNNGMNLKTAQDAWDVLQKHMQRIFELAGDAAEDIINNHPDLKDKVGGNIDQLKQMSEKYGPEGKKQLDQTWDQIRDIVKSGISVDSVNKIRGIVQEKMELVKKIGDETWQKGMEQAKPYLDKSPKVKELIEKNADSLKSGNFSKLFSKIKEAVESGDAGQLEQYVKESAGNAKSKGFMGLDKYLNQVPGGDQIIPKLSQLYELSQKHGKEAEELFKETVQEVSKVLSKKSDEAERLAKKAAKESSS